jgi:flagella basal body P-ring formation protein FlgA
MKRVNWFGLVSVVALMIGFAPLCVGQEGGAPAATVEVAERSEVQTKVVRLGDVARIMTEDKELAERLPNVEIQNAPLPGQTLTVDANLIRTRLRQARFDLSHIQLTLPQRITVVSRAHVVSRSAIIEEAKQFLAKHPAWAGKAVTIDDPQNVNDVVVPAGQVELKAQSNQRNGQPSSLVSVSIYADGRLVRTLNLFLKVHVFADVVVATRTMPHRAILTQSDVQTERRDLSSLPPDVCLDVKDAVGKRLTRAVAKGQPLTRASLETAPDVPAGSKVTVMVVIGQVKITLVGEAREDGWIGKAILIRNADSNKSFRAVVVDAGTASVKVE